MVIAIQLEVVASIDESPSSRSPVNSVNSLE